MKLMVLAVLLLAVQLASQPRPPGERPGPTPDGGVLLNSGWKLTPAGRQIPLDTLPMSSALSKDGRFLLVLNAGYKPPSISVLRVDQMQETGRIPLKDAWLGLTFSPDGKSVYVGGGAQTSVFEFRFENGTLTPTRTLEVVPEAKRSGADFIGDTAVSPDGRLLYAAGVYADAVHVINLQTGRVIEKLPTGRRPYRILFHPDGRSYFVSSWADGAVYHHKAETGERLGVVRLGSHPTDMVWRARKASETGEFQQPWTARIFVAAANTNSVYVIGVNESKDLRMIETIDLSMTPRQPLGMTPTAVALDPEQSRLFVVCSDANTVAVADVSEDDSTVLGYIPTGWYPTAVRPLADKRLVILNGRGVPGSSGRSRAAEQAGSASIIDPFTDEQLDEWSDKVLSNAAYRDDQLEASANPLGNPSPIRHVVYVVKEGSAYDRVLGDLGKGNGDASLTVFNEKIAPNHRKLARDFVLFDNFYVNGDSGADGQNWSAAAIASDFVQKMWPSLASGRGSRDAFQGGEPAAYPPAGYLWTNAAAAGLSIRNYGWWVSNTPQIAATGQPQVERVRDPVLAKATSPNFRGFDPEYPDIERVRVFIEELKEFEQKGELPRLMFVRLANNGGSGTSAGKITPLSAMADNDTALGMLVEAVSKSKFWASTAIFVVEAGASDGQDHVSSHRSPAYVLSPWTRRAAIDSTMYNTASMLRTIELILGLRPVTHFDAGARPMWAAFAKQPNMQSWEAVKPSHPLNERNPAQAAAAAGQRRSAASVNR